MIETDIGIIPALRNTVWLVGSASTVKQQTHPVPLHTGTSQDKDDYAENATGLRARPPKIDRNFQRLFEAAREETFEDGVESQFSRGLELQIRRYGESALESLTYFIIGEKINSEIAAEILRWLGRIKHSSTRASRLWLLKRSLFCASASVRDGALLGLASLDDPATIPHLKQAIDRERIAELREDMQQVLVQLEENLNQWHTS